MPLLLVEARFELLPDRAGLAPPGKRAAAPERCSEFVLDNPNSVEFEAGACATTCCRDCCLDMRAAVLGVETAAVDGLEVAFRELEDTLRGEGAAVAGRATK